MIVSMKCKRGCIHRLHLLQSGHQFAQGNPLRLVVNNASDDEKGV